MKKLIIPFLLGFASTVFAQDVIWDKSFTKSNSDAVITWSGANNTNTLTVIDTNNASGNFTSKDMVLQSWNPREVVFEGMWTLFMQVDTVLSSVSGKDPATEVDSLVFFPRYYLGRGLGYIQGDTLQWTRATDVSGIDSTTKVLRTDWHSGLSWMYRSNGTSTLLQGHAYEQIDIVAHYIGDSTWVELTQTLSKW